jgi:hypothetical protein
LTSQQSGRIFNLRNKAAAIQWPKATKGKKMGKIVKRKNVTMVQMLPISRAAELMGEDKAKDMAAKLNASDGDWTYAANLVNPERCLWEVRYITPEGDSERISF